MEFEKLPLEMRQLKDLTYPDLFGNQLMELSPEIGQLKNLTKLSLEGNQLKSPPPEIVDTGIEAIRLYFQLKKLEENAEQKKPKVEILRH